MKEVDISGPTVNGARRAHVTWIRPGEGRFGGDKHVDQEDATHAVIDEDGGSHPGERTVLRSEAESFIATSAKAWTAEQERRTELRRELAAHVATVVSTCPHCADRPRAYAGYRQLQTGSAGAEALMGALAVANYSVHIYECLVCGSLELFSGRLSHPLPANVPASPS